MLDRLCAAVGVATVAGVGVGFGGAEGSNLGFAADFDAWMWIVEGPGWDGMYVEPGEGGAGSGRSNEEPVDRSVSRSSPAR